MRAFSAIVMLTLRKALRSHVFQLLLILLMLCVAVIPMSISVSKADEFIQVSLLYSLWTVSIILALSSIWLGCFVMSHDIDSYQLHMVVSKPVARWKLWLGKWVGINLINVTLLLLAGIAVYAVVMVRYNAAGKERALAGRESEREMAKADQERIRSTILVGRRSYFPKRLTPEEIADRQLRLRAIVAEKNGEKPKTNDELKAEREQLIAKIKEQPGAVEVLPGKTQEWVFENIPQELRDKKLTLRYRPYLGKVASEDQRETHVLWVVAVPQVNEKTGGYNLYQAPLSNGPEQVFTGIFHEKTLPADLVTPDGEIKIAVANLDRHNGKHFYQVADGPVLLIPVCSFEENFLRGLLVMTIQLLLLSGLACAFGGFLTMPTAVFMVTSYLLFGAFSTILTDPEFFAEDKLSVFGQAMANVLLLVIIPLQKFDITDLLANGKLIEFSYIGELFFQYFILRGLPVFLLGIWLYSRRDLGLAVKK